MVKPIAILIESDFYEHEIWYYHYRFLEAGIEARFVTRLWGLESITFKGHEYHAPFECRESFETLDPASLSAVIVPSGNGVRPGCVTPMTIRSFRRRLSFSKRPSHVLMSSRASFVMACGWQPPRPNWSGAAR